MLHPIRQRTVSAPVRLTGIGVHSGKQVSLTISPAPPNHGIKFVRADLPNQPVISAHFNNVVDTSLATVIGQDGVIVSTVEHLMAAFCGLSIDNAIVTLDSYEIPIMDGSALPFTRILQNAGVQEQDAFRCYFAVSEPISISEGDKSVAIYPSDRFSVTCTIDFTHPMVGRQTLSLDIDAETFAAELSPARTFGFLHEIEYLRRFGFARGGSLDNVVVLDADAVVNEDGLRFTDEFVRHKLLDCIGDFSLLGLPLLGHVVLEKSGHAFNHAFIRKFFSEKRSWETRIFCEADAATPKASNSLAI